MNWNWDQPIGDPLYLPISDFNKQTYGFSFVVKYIFIRLGDVVYERYRCLYLYSVYIVNIEFLGRKVLTVDTKQCNRIQLRFYVCQITRFPAPNSGRKTRTHLLAQKHPHANTHTHTLTTAMFINIAVKVMSWWSTCVGTVSIWMLRIVLTFLVLKSNP